MAVGIFKMQKIKITSEQASLLRESVEDQTYFQTYTGALQKVFTEIRDKGFDVEFDNTARPKVGETVRMTFPLTYKGQAGGVYVHIQVYNRDNAARDIATPYELNYYYSFTHPYHRNLNKNQFAKLIEFLDSNLEMYDDQDIQHYVDGTTLPQEVLMDYYQYYGMNDARIEELNQEYAEFRNVKEIARKKS